MTSEKQKLFDDIASTKSFTYDYDQAGNRITVTYPASVDVELVYDYDSANRVEMVDRRAPGSMTYNTLIKVVRLLQWILTLDVRTIGAYMPTHRRFVHRYIIGVFFVAFGVVVLPTLATVYVLRLDRQRIRVKLPGTHVIHLPKTGEYVAYLEVPNSEKDSVTTADLLRQIPDHLTVEPVASVSDSITVVRSSALLHYGSDDGPAGIPVADFEVDRPGEYRITLPADSILPSVVIAIPPPAGVSKALTTIAAAVLIALCMLLIGILIIANTLSLQRRNPDEQPGNLPPA